MERIFILGVTLLTVVDQVISAGGIQFTVEPEDIVVEQGGPARLDCQAKSVFGEAKIEWRTDDGQPITFFGDNYRSQLPNGSLYISSVYSGNPELTGGYQCLASVDNVGSIVSRSSSIRLASLPGFEKEPQNTIVNEGQVVYFSCSLSMFSKQIEIKWLKDEHTLMLDDTRMTILPSGALEIDDVRIQDAGVYMCNASGFGQYRLSNKGQLTMLPYDNDQATAPVFIAKPMEQVAVEGSSVTLECAVNGNPKPSVSWLKDGVAIDLALFGSRYLQLASSSLMIMEIKEEDHGSYQCRAKNKVETLDAVAEVYVQVPPKFIKRPQDKTANENQDLEFECEIHGKPEPKVTWLKNGERINFSEYWQLASGHNLRINGLLAIDAGIFQCIGINPAGSIQASARLTINLPKKVNSRKATTPKSMPKKKLQFHRQLYNNTWQHPSTLLGHTLSAYTQNPPLSISPSDDPSDLLDSIRGPNPSYDPDSRFIDDTETFESIGGSVPSAPRNLSLVIVESRFITLRWQEPEDTNGNITAYYVYYKQENSQRERVINTSHKQTEAVIPSLQPSTTYNFRIIAHNSHGTGSSSEILRVTTHSEVNVPGPPMNFDGHPTSSSSIALSWEEPQLLNGKISKYIVTYSEEDDEESKGETLGTTYELINLVPYTEYTIWVQAENENGPGASSNEIVIRTYSSQPTKPPHNVTLEAASSTSVIIRWEPPLDGQNGIIIGYKIRYKKQDRRNMFHPITTESNQRFHTLSDLEEHVSYQVRICAFNVNGTGPWSDWMSIETYENDLDESVVPNEPENFKGEATSNSIYVKWNAPKDQSIKVRGYVLTWGKGYPDVDRVDLDGKQRYYTIENLDPLSEYVFALRAMNEAGGGSIAYVKVWTTAVSLPESSTPLLPPVALKAIVISSTTVVLYWTDSTLSKNQYVTDNRHYSVRFTIFHHSITPKYKYYDSTDLNCMIHDLKPFTQYEFAVKLVKGKRQSPWSMVVLNQTQEAAPSSPPRELTVQSVNERPTSVLITWQSPKLSNGPITGYIIFYSIDNTKVEGDWLVEGVIGDKEEFIVKGLNPSTVYYFKMKARNSKGYGPFSSTVNFKTPQSNGKDFYDDLHGRDGRGLSGILIYIIVGCSVILLMGVAGVVVVCCRRNPDSSERKKGYLNEPNQKTNIKPPDLWIHHDQMELKALEKSSVNGEASTSGVSSNTLPRSNNQDYNQESMHGNSSSLDKRTYIPSYMGNNDEKCSTLSRQQSRGSHKPKPKLITLPVDSAPFSQLATATPIVNNSISQSTIHSSCGDVAPLRQNYPRPAAQYSLNRAHITLEPTPESNPDSCNINSNYEPMPSQLTYNNSSNQNYSASGQYASGRYGNSNQSTNSTGDGTESNNSSKRLQGHPLKSFSVPAPPPQSAPSTPAQQKHAASQVIVRPAMSGSPYKKTLGASQLTKNRLVSASSTNHTPEEVERLKPSYSTEELNQEMATLDGLMKDLNAITASEFEC
ncbi:neogenin isoform X2 [Leptopilina heterotoma]|uniref:neogenin isoform X2 n=1 Tax=Leptopilina heterotoma TaxID=63436 RepID=UPI001CAA3453|nr:neogenin isoform X2 [Leptopilina heterotoma]